MKSNLDLVKLVKENQIVAIVIIAALTVLIIYLVVFIPLIKELKVKYLECRFCENHVLEGRNAIEYARGIDKSFGTRVLISEKEAAAGIDEFTKHGRSLGVSFLSMKPKEVIVKEGVPYKILPIEIEIEATDQQFVNFMGSIDELKKAIVTVDSFEITPDKQDRRQLNAKMILDIYLSTKENSAEEL